MYQKLWENHPGMPLCHKAVSHYNVSYRQVHARQKLPSFPVKVFSVDSATWNYTIWNKLLGHSKIFLKSNMAAKIQNGRQIT